MNEIDILTNAGLSRTTAEMVAALHTLASTIGAIAGQHGERPPEPPAHPQDATTVSEEDEGGEHV